VIRVLTGWMLAVVPDVLSSRPRLGMRPPTPICEVPLDGLLRRLWLVRAELAYDQAGGMRARSFMGDAVVRCLRRNRASGHGGLGADRVRCDARTYSSRADGTAR